MTPAKTPRGRATFPMPEAKLACPQAIKVSVGTQPMFSEMALLGLVRRQVWGIVDIPDPGCDAAFTCGPCLEQNVNETGAARKARSRSGAFYFLKLQK